MAKTPDPHTDTVLDDLFAEAQQAATQPVPDALHSAILRDAATLMPRPAPTQASRWRGIFDEIGGWATLAGLSTAMMAGLWIGIAQPDALSPLLSTPQSDTLAPDLDSFFPDYSGLFEEI